MQVSVCSHRTTTVAVMTAGAAVIRRVGSTTAHKAHRVGGYGSQLAASLICAAAPDRMAAATLLGVLCISSACS